MKTSNTVVLNPNFVDIEAFHQPVKNDFQAVDTLIIKELSSPAPLIQTIARYIIHGKGKRLRPLIVLLTAHACGYDEDIEHQELATVIEFIHTATLLHDDVIDKSSLRRGKKTVNAMWGNQASVLVGDFLYSRAFQILSRRENIAVMKVLANTTSQIAEGEMWQLMNQNDPEVDENTYYEIIRRKTAQLFSASSEIGTMIGIVGKKNKSLRKTMAAFGFHLGMAYQIIDDLLDYSENFTELGKNIGDDLSEGKVTLPLIYAKQKASSTEVKLINKAIINGGLNDLKTIIQIIDETKAREYTQQCALHEAEKAQTYLKQLPFSIYRQTLEKLVEFVIYRRY